MLPLCSALANVALLIFIWCLCLCVCVCVCVCGMWNVECGVWNVAIGRESAKLAKIAGFLAENGVLSRKEASQQGFPLSISCQDLKEVTGTVKLAPAIAVVVPKCRRTNLPHGYIIVNVKLGPRVAKSVVDGF